jgi:hypothetical protein
MNPYPEAGEQRRQPHASSATRNRRRLSDTILVAFHIACDHHDVEVASCLLRVLEFMAERPRDLPTGKERRTQESLVAAYERLWQIRHPAENGGDEVVATPVHNVLA